ncbi:MAG: radical SAM protein [Promethearchaeota archaeon]|nr:MAG: radical SAM protein [Candidatus Lokiarchaeota archaeon]
MIDAETALEIKTELLCKGLYLKDSLKKHYQEQGITYGRKGGAGPLGGRYFLLEDDETLVNVALWDDSERTNLLLSEKKGGYFIIQNTENQKPLFNLKLVPNPRYYDPKYKTSDGIPMKKIALVHGVDCLASTIYQKCKYWACGEACQFCGIELSLKYDTTILEKNYRQMNEVIAQAKKEGRCSHMTLTSGTEEGEDKGANRYIELLKGVRKENPDLPLHVQIEPLEELDYINKLKKAGADTIGIHVEIIDEELRREITPGKAKVPYDLFKTNWKHALDVFGENQVETFVLTGFEENKIDLVIKLEEIIAMGVIPFLTPVRSIPNFKRKLPLTNHQKLLTLYKKVGRLMKEHGVNPLENKAGCVRCGGCSAINEAYKAS